MKKFSVDIQHTEEFTYQVEAKNEDDACVSTGFHGGITYGFGRPDDHGYFDIGDPVAARAAEKRDNQPVGTYWPFH